MPMMHLPIFFSGAGTGTGTGTGALYDCQNGIDITLKSMGKINLYQTATKHNKAQTICKFLGLCITASHHAVRYRYNAVSFLTNSHILHPIAHLWELEKRFLLWVELWYMLQWLHRCMQYHIIWGYVSSIISYEATLYRHFTLCGLNLLYALPNICGSLTILA